MLSTVVTLGPLRPPQRLPRFVAGYGRVPAVARRGCHAFHAAPGQP